MFVLRDDKLLPVGYFSKLISKIDIPKSIYVKEMYALISSLKHFRPIIKSSSHPLTIYTKVKNLVYLSRKNSLNVTATAISGILVSLANELQMNIIDYPYQIDYLTNIFSRSIGNSRFFDRKKGEISGFPMNWFPGIKQGIRLSEDQIEDMLSKVKTKSLPKQVIGLKSLKDLEEKALEDSSPEKMYEVTYELLLHWNRIPVEDRFKVESFEYLLDQFHTGDAKNLERAMMDGLGGRIS